MLAVTYDELGELLRGRRCAKGRDRLARDGQCWVFMGARNRDGYGHIRRSGFSGKAHRYVWLQAVGPIPDGLHVLHTCDNPACVRPSHLWLGTHRDNMQDMLRKGRAKLSGLTMGSEVSRHIRMTKWTSERRSESARHAALSRHAGRTLAQAKSGKGKG